jgi:hypothetical protein
MVERCLEDDRKPLARMRKPAHLFILSPPSLSLVNAWAAAFKACNRLSQPAIWFQLAKIRLTIRLDLNVQYEPQARSWRAITT